MKRLVICCDGTWNRPDNAHVTNIEKIARTIETDPVDGDPPAQQMVLYLSGVGTSGYTVDRLLGGAFGFGLFDNVRTGYRFLALNYDPGDEVFVFGFSRGAYTARSLVGMIGRVGLLTRESLIADHLPEAVARYRRKRPDRHSFHGTSDQRFKQVHSHPDVQVTFLGVFDTVGALGVPGAFRRGHQFHDVNLSTSVRCARQALAVDEHRMKFEPALWESPPPDGSAPASDPDVRQVWFEGAHSDVGGGYGDTGLSDTALGWMVREAREAGLAFDEDLLRTYLDSGSAAIRHDSLSPTYKLLNGLSRARLALLHPPPDRRHFAGHDRVVGYPRGVGIRIASSASGHYLTDRADRQDAERLRAGRGWQPREWYEPANLVTYARETTDFADRLEVVPVRPLSAAEVR